MLELCNAIMALRLMSRDWQRCVHRANQATCDALPQRRRQNTYKTATTKACQNSERSPTKWQSGLIKSNAHPTLIGVWLQSRDEVVSVNKWRGMILTEAGYPIVGFVSSALSFHVIDSQLAWFSSTPIVNRCHKVCAVIGSLLCFEAACK